MIEQYASLAASFKGAEFRYEDKKVKGHLGSFLPITHYYIHYTYKGYLIEAKNELGNFNLGTVTVDLKQNDLPDFKITATDQFTNLFLRRKNILKVQCKDSIYKSKLIEYSIASELEKIAKENSFEPTIYPKHNIGQQLMITSYSLQLEDKIGALKAIFNFYMHIIDDL